MDHQGRRPPHAPRSADCAVNDANRVLTLVGPATKDDDHPTARVTFIEVIQPALVEHMRSASLARQILVWNHDGPERPPPLEDVVTRPAIHLPEPGGCQPVRLMEAS